MVRQVFITGATSGIGEAIAQAFQAEGDQVVASGATELEVENASQKSANAGIDFRVLDVRDLAAVQGMVGSMAELDVVVNCAGIIQRSIELEPEAFARTIDINLNGTMRVCAAAREGLKARRGCIINTASMLSFFGGGLVPGYSASKGGGPALNDVIGGQVPLFFGNLASTLQHVQSGKLRALAVTSGTRSPILPDVPTLSESGLKGTEIYEWNAIFTPANTPEPVMKKLAAAFQQALESPEVKARIAQLGGEIQKGNPEQAKKFIDQQTSLWQRVIKERNITTE